MRKNEIYENTPENQERFERFWDDVDEIIERSPYKRVFKKPLKEVSTCEQMVRQKLKELDEFKPTLEFSISDVREILITCLRGC